MGVVSITAWLCDFPTCGHVWYTAKEPLRCSKCKRKNWNKVKGDVVRAPKTRKRKPAGKGTAKPPVVSQPDKSTRPGHITNGDVMEDLGLTEPEPVVESNKIEVDLGPFGYEGTKVTSEVVDGSIRSLTITNPGPTPAFEPPPEPQREPVLPTIVRQPTAAKYREILKNLAEHKIGEKCPHGWANWLQCPKCNQRVGE